MAFIVLCMRCYFLDDISVTLSRKPKIFVHKVSAEYHQLLDMVAAFIISDAKRQSSYKMTSRLGASCVKKICNKVDAGM